MLQFCGCDIYRTLENNYKVSWDKILENSHSQILFRNYDILEIMTASLLTRCIMGALFGRRRQ